MPDSTDNENQINFELQQASLMNEFTSSVQEVDHELEADQKARNDEVEAEEKAGAEDILQELDKS